MEIINMLNEPFFVPAVIILVLSLPLIFGWVPRQCAIGIRTAKTLSDDLTWYRANRFGGSTFLASSLIYLFAADALPCLAPCGLIFSQWLLHLFAFAAPLLVSILLIRSYVDSL